MKLDAVPITPRAKKSANPVRAKAYGMRELEVTLRYHNDEVERRGIAASLIEAALSQSSTSLPGPPKTQPPRSLEPIVRGIPLDWEVLLLNTAAGPKQT
jgi:hypothetical protein